MFVFGVIGHGDQCTTRSASGTPYKLGDWLARNDGAVRALASTIYGDRAFDLMPILADALEDAGCDDSALLDHCHAAGPHVWGCWVIDALLGRA